MEMKYSDEEIRTYFMQLDRSRFITEQKELATLDRPLPIGHGQTISQPSLVLTMTLKLELTSGDKVLEIGTGSGFQTALLSRFSHSVYTVERIRALHEVAKQRLVDLGYENVFYHYGDGHAGWPEHAPYDKIMVTAAAEEMPENLVAQLAPGGKMVIPIGGFFGQELKLIEKDGAGTVKASTIEHVMFVKFKRDIE